MSIVTKMSSTKVEMSCEICKEKNIKYIERDYIIKKTNLACSSCSEKYNENPSVNISTRRDFDNNSIDIIFKVRNNKQHPVTLETLGNPANYPYLFGTGYITDGTSSVPLILCPDTDSFTNNSYTQKASKFCYNSKDYKSNKTPSIVMHPEEKLSFKWSWTRQELFITGNIKRASELYRYVADKYNIINDISSPPKGSKDLKCRLDIKDDTVSSENTIFTKKERKTMNTINKI